MYPAISFLPAYQFDFQSWMTPKVQDENPTKLEKADD
jgi:hypothetical protein